MSKQIPKIWGAIDKIERQNRDLLRSLKEVEHRLETEKARSYGNGYAVGHAEGLLEGIAVYKPTNLVIKGKHE